MIFEEARVYVPVTGPQGSLGWFILDTGAARTLIDARLAGGLTVSRHTTATGAGRGNLSVGHAGAITLSVGGIALQEDSPEVAALDGLLAPYTGRHIGGIIGGNFIGQHVITLDFAQQRIFLSDPKNFVYRGSGVVLPIRLESGEPVAKGKITLPDGAVLPLRLLIDLGAKANLLVSQPFTDKHHLLARLGRHVEEPLGAGIGGETRYDFVHLPDLQVGGLSAQGLIVGLSANGTLRGGGYDALLGAGFLARYRRHHRLSPQARMMLRARRSILAPRRRSTAPAPFSSPAARRFTLTPCVTLFRARLLRRRACGPEMDGSLGRWPAVRQSFFTLPEFAPPFTAE